MPPLIGASLGSSGVTPITMSKLAASSPIFDSATGLKSTSTLSRAVLSRMSPKTPSRSFSGLPLMNSCVV